MLVDAYWPAVALEIPLCAVVGMAAMFSGSVRAPLTGIVLIIEMTGLGNQAVSLMAACIPAAIIPFWLQQAGIYDDLRERLLRAQH
jgi:CIC family chloride channel protein